MKNTNLRRDLNSLRGDYTINQVLDENERYIEFLEGKEERLTKLENGLNDIENGNLANKDEFLKTFEGLKNA